MKDYVELLEVKPFYRLFWDDGYRFDYSDDHQALKEQIRNKAPADWDGYLKFLRYSEEVFHEGYEKLVHVPFLNISSMAAVAPQLIRLQAYRSVYGVVSKFVRDPHLRQLLSFHSLLVGGNPFTTTSIYTLIHCLERKWGVFFPKGGTGRLVQALVTLFEELGPKAVEKNHSIWSSVTRMCSTPTIRCCAMSRARRPCGESLPGKSIACRSF
jgi:phytoene desaturase